MQSRKSSLVALLTTFLVGLTTQSAVGFTITPQPNFFNKLLRSGGASIRYKPIDVYDTGVIKGMTFLDPTYVEELKLGGTQDFLQKLKQEFGQEQGWSYEIGQNLNGRFDIEYYYACGYEKDCGGDLLNPLTGEIFTSRNDGVGAGFQLRYYPGEGDPTPDLNALHWIQRVTSLYERYEDIIDKGPQNENPFYDTLGAADEEYFVDRPYDAPRPKNFFEAQLYLVEQKDPINTPQKITIYNGVKWGWKHKISKFYKKIVDSLSSNQEEDRFQLSELTPGAKFYAYINNDIPGNICNPNTVLTAYDNYGTLINGDNDSSQIGDGFASALTGTVSSNGTIELRVSSGAGSNGLNRRGQDRGNYELNIMMFDNEDFPFVVGSSGGGGVASSSGGGGVQQNPILPNGTEQGWQVFRNVPGCRWYDPHTPYGFEFQALDDTLFTEILDFPVGDDNQFTVSVGDRILGEFGAGDRVDFTSLFGSGISNFKITGIDSLFGSTEETAFPIQLAFNDRTGSFKMRPFSQESSPASVPESTSALGLLALGAWGIIKAMKIRLEK
jgi:hypothetical protein